MEIKSGLAHILKSFEIAPTENTPLPEKMIRDLFGYRTPKGLKLRFTPRN